jgi:hypothetical protein
MESLEPSQHLLLDIGKPRKTCVEVASRRTFRMAGRRRKLKTTIHNFENSHTKLSASEEALTAFVLTKCQREFSNEGSDEMSGESD